MTEWQYAMRAGSKTKYFWGDQIEKFSEYCAPGSFEINSPGVKKPNPWGLYDVIGHQQEWCADWLCPRFVPEGTSDTEAEKQAFSYNRGENAGVIRFRVLAGDVFYGDFPDPYDFARTKEQVATGICFAGGAVDCPYYGFRVVLAPTR